MRVGIITLPLHNYNYGGILQAYALQVVLKKMRVKAEHLDRDYNINPFKKKLFNFINSLFFSSFTNTRKEFYEPFEHFLSTKMNISPHFFNSEDLQSYVTKNNFDVLVTGSDQVWRQEYALSIYKDLFLAFNNDSKTRKISYAASFGKKEWTHREKTQEISSYIKNLDAISVREDDGVELCEKIFKTEAQHHIDPTLLLEVDDYKGLLESKNIKKSVDLVCYFLDDTKEKRDVAEYVSQERSYDPLVLGKKPIISRKNFKRFKNTYCDSIEDWLINFLEAKYVITDSFHGVVFSILFNKQFVAIGNKERGLSRFDSILNTLDLKSRLVLNGTKENIDNLLHEPIDFIKVNKLLDYERQKALNYLHQNIFNKTSCQKFQS